MDLTEASSPHRVESAPAMSSMDQPGAISGGDGSLTRKSSAPEIAAEKPKHVIAYSPPRPLVEFSNLPEYLRDNEFIHKHYRADWPLSQALWSVFGIHNETGNIWTHIVGFLIFVSLTVYTAMKVPSVVEIPASALNLQRLGDRLPAAPSLASLRESFGSQIPKSLTNLQLPQLRHLQERLASLEMPRLEQLQTSLSDIELPQLAEIQKSLQALYESLPSAPQLPTLAEIRKAAQISGASLYEAMPSLPSMQDAEVYFYDMAEKLSQIPRMGQDAVSEGLSHLPHVKDVHQAAELYIAAMAQRLGQLSKMRHAQGVAEPFLNAVSQRFSHLPRIPDVQGAAGQYFAAAADRLSHLELLHTLHHLEMLMLGVEVSTIQQGLHSLVSYYACVMNSMLQPTLQNKEVCLLGERVVAKDPPVCPVQERGFLANMSMPNGSGQAEEKDSRALPLSGSPVRTCPAPVLYTTPVVRWPLFLYLAGAMSCLLLSASCHLLGCISCEVSRVLWRFDYAGIAALISSSFFPPVFYGFLCQPVVRTVYLAAVVIMGTCTVAVSLLPAFQTTKFRHIRAGLFFGMGVSGIVPCLHKFLFYSDEPMVVTTTLLELFMGSLYGIGALFYASRVPERWLPGKFDIAGHSHQIFHVLVIAGAYTHYRTGLLYLQWRDVHGCGVM